VTNLPKRQALWVWVATIVVFAVLHAINLTADFPNHTPWFCDWAKYTDEGWYGNAAIRTLLSGHWYVKGDFNPLPAVPVWQLLEYVIFSVTGVSIQAARGLAISFFFANLFLSYKLLRLKSARWVALLALTLIVTSPFLYAFSRLAILEPILTSAMLVQLNVMGRLDRFRRPVLISAACGLLFTIMMLTKTTAIFLLPALGWMLFATLWSQRKLAVKCALAAGCTFAVSFGAYMATIIHAGLLDDYRYFFFINDYVKPEAWNWPLWAFWWTFHGTLWVDLVLLPLAGVVILLAFVAFKQPWARAMWRNPLFGASILAIAGYIFFMTYQNHPQPRYYAVVAFFAFFLAVLGIESLLGSGKGTRSLQLGQLGLAVAIAAALGNGAQTLNFALHPEFTWINAARQLTNYIDQHPNGNRLLVSISGDEITMMTHLPSLCDDFGTQDLATKLADYQPGWYAAWNDLDPGTLEDIHTHFWLEQVASFHALDDPERNVLVLFKLHPLRHGVVREPSEQNLQVELPDDKFEVDIE